MVSKRKKQKKDTECINVIFTSVKGSVILFLQQVARKKNKTGI